jgi:uncharacterized protein (DUF362 family)
MDLIIAGNDVVATDATAARIMGFDPVEIAHIRKAHEKGLGNIGEMEILGSKLDDVRRVFKRN